MNQMKFISNIFDHFNDHPNQTKNPQSYCKHAYFAIYNSFYLMFAGFIGMFHGVFPFCFPFYTSTVVVQSFKKLLESQRHNNEVHEVLRGGVNDEKVFVIRSDNKAPKEEGVKNLQITIQVSNI